LHQFRLEEEGLMRREHMGYALLAPSLLVVPACGGPGTGAANDRDQPATERAAGATNVTPAAEPRRPEATGGDQATGTSGSIRRATEADMGVGPDAAVTMKIQAAYTLTVVPPR